MNIMVNRTLRYGSAVVLIIATFILRQVLESVIGAELPPWITSYPVVMCVALMAGLGPGILATVTAALLVEYLVFPPVGSFKIESITNLLSLSIFVSMGLFMSVVAERYRRTQTRLEELVKERTVELSRANEGLKIEMEERKIVDDTLRESEQQQRQAHQLVETVTSGTEMMIATVDRDFRYTFFNQKHHDELNRLTGKNTEIGMSVMEALSDMPEERDRAMELWGRALNGETVVQSLIFGDPGRYRRWYSTRHTPIRDASGQIIGAGEVTSDITERKRAEEGLRITLESIGDAFFAVDREWRFVYVNAPAERILGIKREEVLGKSHWNVFPSTMGTELERRYRLAADGQAQDWESFYEPWGRWFHNRCFPREGGGMSVYFHEITDRKLAEETLREAYDEMTRLVEAQTRDLKEKEVLLKEIHHRVKNNMQVISSLVGLQASNTTDETVRSVLSDVTDRVRSMAFVHEKLYQSANFASIDFAEYANALLGYLWHVHSNEAAAVRLTLDLDPVSLPMDKAVPCGLILNELAGNTLKHAFRGRDKGEVTISLFGDSEERIHLCVKDNGVGLPEGFDWLQAQTLGLNLVQLLSRQLRADVEVCGSDGTMFEISFTSSMG